MEVNQISFEKPMTKTKPNVSVCIPSTVISDKNGYNLQQITSIVYQIARAATIFQIKEIVVLDIGQDQGDEIVAVAGGGKKIFGEEDLQEDEQEQQHDRNRISSSYLLASLLQFFITPPYLIKTIFNKINSQNPQIIKKFKYAYKLPKITTLPFMNDSKSHFKEGITVSKKSPKIIKKGKVVKNTKKIEVTKYVNIGEAEPLKLNIKQDIPINSRVTIDLTNKTIVSPKQAYGSEGNLSTFGYYVRICKKFSQIFTESSIETGYSKSVFINCDDYYLKHQKQVESLANYKPENENIILIIGNYQDYQQSFQKDKLNLLGVENMIHMFDNKLDIPANVRIEDCLLMALTKING